MENLTLEKRQLCDIQGRLFELALTNGLDCPAFIEAFMNSRTAAALDDVYDRLQWAGEEYILDELNDEVRGLRKAGTTYSSEIMYWIGYIYPVIGIITRVKKVMKYIKWLMLKQCVNVGLASILLMLQWLLTI